LEIRYDLRIPTSKTWRLFYILKQPEFKDFKLIWALKDWNNNSHHSLQVVKIDSFKYFLTSLRAKYWVASVNIERGLNFKKKGNIYLNTWHGIPIKKIGNSVKNRKDYNFQNVNFFVISGEYEKNIYKNDFRLNENSIIKTGMPRNEELHKKLSSTKKKEIFNKLNIDINKKIILYAPTWRDNFDGRFNSIMPPIDFLRWEKELGDEYIIILRIHPYTNMLMNITFNSFIHDYSNYENLNELILISDILISDYSAILFDYSITEKPMYCFAYDLDDYSRNRGLYLNLNNEFPGGVLLNEDDLLIKIKEKDKTNLINEIIKFKHKYIEYHEKSTEKCVNYLFKGENL
jgi:CDP-glycerol glycerophosphotransferase